MKFINYITYLQLKFIKTVVEHMPLKMALLIGKCLGNLAYCFLSKRKRITIRNLEKAFPEKRRSWCYKNARKVFENFGRNMMEFIKYSTGKLFNIVDVEGMERLNEGVILLTAHLGNWEITGMSVAASGRELYPVGRRIHNLAFDRIVDDLRTAYGSAHIPYHGSIKEIFRKIKSRKNICILIDQRMRSGLPVKFFNRPVWCTHVVSVLHRKTGVEVVPGFSYHSGGRIKVCYEKSLDFVTDKEPLKADFVNTQRQLDWLERKIRERPDEWFWMHNFWKDEWPAVFLDRDGTINKDHGYISSKNELEFIPGVLKAMRKLRKAGYLLIVVTNQSGIARGYYTEADYLKVNEFFLDMLKSEGVIIDKVYHCSHHPDDNCYYRKPNPGMVLKAKQEFNINLNKSFVIGDKASDINLGKGLRIKNIMVKTGYGNQEINKVIPDFTADDLAQAAEIILDI